ncbi:MAG TPA: glycosyltransferase [bacterium]|nr:glycosyltransferase [bacterium]
MKQIGVLYVAHDAGAIGGAERQLLELFKGLDRERFRPVLVCLERGGPVAKQAAELGVPVHHVTRRWRWDLSVAWRLARLAKREHLSIVHGYLGLPGFYSAIAATLAGARVIATIRIAGPRRRISDTTERIAFFAADSIISNSQAGVDYYFRRWPGRAKTKVIYNGYVLADFDPTNRRERSELGLPDRVALIGHVANLTFLKDYPTFLMALAMVFSENKDAVAVILGEGKMRQVYQALAEDLRISDRVLFMGHRRDVLDIVKHLDLGVLASHPAYSEGLSNSIAEYMGMAKPVVATATGGNCELVRDGVTGFLVPPGEPGPLAEKILKVLTQPELGRTMGTAGRRFFEENLTLDRMVAETQKVYETLIGT